MKSIVLKIDVDTFRGTREGVPRLVELLRNHRAGATFLFSLGPDHTGWALRRALRPGFLKKVKRTSVLEHYGWKTLMYGVLLPGPHIGRSCRKEMVAVRDAGFQVGIHAYDHVYWQDNVMKRDFQWTDNQLEKAAKTFRQVFGDDAPTHGAAGWQMNDAAFDFMERFEYASDCRGTTPFYPIVRNRRLRCLQMPTTLPTMDELLGRNGVDEKNIAEALLEKTRQAPELGHVFTLHAELEGMKLLVPFGEFLRGLVKQGYELLSMNDYYRQLDKSKVPYMPIRYSEIPGRSGVLCCQYGYPK